MGEGVVENFERLKKCVEAAKNSRSMETKVANLTAAFELLVEDIESELLGGDEEEEEEGELSDAELEALHGTEQK